MEEPWRCQKWLPENSEKNSVLWVWIDQEFFLIDRMFFSIDRRGIENRSIQVETLWRNNSMFAFYERLSVWGERLFTPCRPFAKGPRFINMVMNFVLHPFSHYNSITEPRARFLLSLLEHFTIDFHSHFILFIIDVHLDSASRDKLIFPSAITRILRHFFRSFSLFWPFHHYVCHRLRYC